MRLVRIAVLAAATLFALPLHAQVGPDVAEPWEEARALYRDGDYEQAARFIIEAIQREPREPRYYLGLARTQNWLGAFDLAVFYYDIYLVDLVGELPDNLDRRDRIDAVRAERDSANAERDDPEAPLVLPAAQEAARAALEERLVQGLGMTATGGGAAAMYDTLLRTGYARPDLGALRERLGAALLAEVRNDIDSGRALLPVLSFPNWQLHERRLDRWQMLELDDAVAGSRVGALLALVTGQQQYVNGNAIRALEQFDAALAADAHLLPAYTARLNACVQVGAGCRPDAARYLEEAYAAIDAADPVNVGFLDVYAAALAARAGDDRAAAEALLELLAP